MAIIASSKKAHRRSLVLRARNFDFRRQMKEAIKAVRKAVEDGKDATELMKLLSVAFSSIDKAGRRNIIHRKNADRKKLRLNKLVRSAVAA